LNPKNPLSVFMGILYSACCLAVVVWVTPYLVDAVVEGINLRFILASLVFLISAYWLYAGVIWIIEDWSGEDLDKLRPRRLSRPYRE